MQLRSAPEKSLYQVPRITKARDCLRAPVVELRASARGYVSCMRRLACWGVMRPDGSVRQGLLILSSWIASGLFWLLIANGKRFM